jgi:hypothetical protein
VPLIKPTHTCLAVFVTDVRWEMELGVVDALDLEARRKLVVAIRHFPTAQYMDLRLDWNCRTLGDTVDIDAVMRDQEWIYAMRKAAGLFVRVEAASPLVRAPLTDVQVGGVYFEVSRYCCCGVSISGCPLKTNSLCL